MSVPLVGDARAGAVGDPPLRANVPIEEEIARLTGELREARQARDEVAVADALFGLSIAATDRGELVEAGRLAEESQRVAQELGDRAREGWALLARGDVAFFYGEYPAALERYLRAQQLFESVEDRFSTAAALKSVGVARKLMGHVEEGIEALLSAAATFEALGKQRDLHSALENIGTGYAALGDVPLADDYLRRALELARRLGDDTSTHHTLVRLAVLHLDIDAPGLALDEAREAAGIAERLGLRLHATWPESLESRALEALGRTDEAIEVELRVLDRAKEIGSPSFLVGPCLSLARLHLQRAPERSLEWIRQAETFVEATGYPVGWGLDAAYARAYRRLGRLDEAVRHFERALDGIESERDNILFDRYRAAHLHRFRGLYVELVATLYDLERQTGDGVQARRAFGVLERANARSLIESIAEAGLDQSWPLEEDLRLRRADLERKIAAYHRELARPATPLTRRREILGELDSLDGEWGRWVVDVKRRDPRFASMRYPQPVDLEGARQVLDGCTALVAYLMGEDGFFAFVLTNRDYELLWLDADPEVVDARVQALLDLMNGNDPNAWHPIARRLHEELLASVRDVLRPEIERLILVPDGTLHFLPFDVLIDGIRGRYVIEDFEVSFTPSATVLAQLRDRAAGDRGRDQMMMLADPVVPDPGRDPSTSADQRTASYEREGFELPRLPYTEQEALLVSRFAKDASEIYLGAAATESKLKDRSLDRFGVIHFATHGLVSSQRPLRSALLLSDEPDGSQDGFLEVREIYELHLASELIVLSACRGARGRVLRGEGVEGLGQAFLHAGARSVVASVLDIADDRAVQLMELFYGGLADGLSTGAALRAAKLAMLRERRIPARAWAGFAVIGDPSAEIALSRPPEPASRALWGAALIAALLLSVAIGSRYLRPRR